MKRHGKLFNKIVDIENIRQAYKEAAKGKKKKKIVVWCESHLDEVCKNISEMLITKKYKTSRYRTMMIYRPKKREIYDLPFYPDRIVHHALMRVIEPIWEKLFIVNSYACIRGRGLHSGSTMTMSYVRKYKYCLKMDISKFYPSINHEVLYGIVEHKIKCPDTLWLLKEIIHSVPGGKNVPIGTILANVWKLYLNELDQYLKHKHHVKAFVRYCDDFCIYHNDKKYLNQISKTIEGYLAKNCS
jgi:retron-type reverse transcriptase